MKTTTTTVQEEHSIWYTCTVQHNTIRYSTWQCLRHRYDEVCSCSLKEIPNTSNRYFYTIPFIALLHSQKHHAKSIPCLVLTISADCYCFVLVVVVVVDSHIQRIVLATEETTVTQQVSHRSIKCQSRLWSQRGTKVNGSHHGDNSLLRPTGIRIATKSYAALQAMAPTIIKTVHQTSLLHIESDFDRMGMLSFSAKNRKNYAPTSFDQQVQDFQGHTLYRNKKNEIPRSMVVEALSWRSWRASQHPAVQSPVHP